MRFVTTAFIGFAALLALAPTTDASAQSAEYFAQLQRDKAKCDRAGKEWDGRRCHAKGFLAAPKCKEGFTPVDGKCKKVSPWKNPNCRSWQSKCNAGSSWACGKFESKCQVN